MIVKRRGLQFSISVQGSFTEKVTVEQKKPVHIWGKNIPSKWYSNSQLGGSMSMAIAHREQGDREGK